MEGADSAVSESPMSTAVFFWCSRTARGTVIAIATIIATNTHNQPRRGLTDVCFCAFIGSVCSHVGDFSAYPPAVVPAEAIALSTTRSRDGAWVLDGTPRRSAEADS